MPPAGEFELIARHFTRPVAGRGARHRRRLRAAGAARRHAARDLDRHAGRGAPFPVDRRARAARPQGAGGQPERPGRLRRRAARLHAGAGAAARRRAPSWPALRAACSALADAHGCELIGGDTTQGPLNICVTVFGEVPAGQALLRSGARAGDELWVSGTLGDARLALEVFRGTLRLDGDAFEQARARDGDAAAAGRARAGAARHRDQRDRPVRRAGRRPRPHPAALRRRRAHRCRRAAAQRAAARRSRRRCSGCARWPAATTTSCCSARRPHAADAVRAAGSALRRRASRASGRSKPGQALRVVDAAGAPIDALPRGFDHFAD